MAFIFYPDPRLRKAAEPVAAVDEATRSIGERLWRAATEARAYGLAAAHIGEVAPVAVINTAPDQTERRDLVLYNPRVVAVAEETEAGPEASVSMPGIEVDIVRPVWTEIAYLDEGGRVQTAHFEGFVARCALHEIDQVNGVFFLMRLSRLKREMAIKKYEKATRAG